MLSELPAETQRAIFTLFGNVIKVIEARNTEAYEDALEKIPEEYRNKYHELLLMGVVFTVRIQLLWVIFYLQRLSAPQVPIC